MVYSVFLRIFSPIEAYPVKKMTKNRQKWLKMAFKIFLEYFNFFFGRKWSNKRCSYWSELTPCRISKKSKKIFRGMPAQACHILGPKKDFDGLLLENRHFWEQMTNRKVVDNGLYYLNMHFWPNR